jgi:hypothetical protein
MRSLVTVARLGHSCRFQTPAQQPSQPCESFAFIAIYSAQALRQAGMRVVEECCKQRAANGANPR